MIVTQHGPVLYNTQLDVQRRSVKARGFWFHCFQSDLIYFERLRSVIHCCFFMLTFET